MVDLTIHRHTGIQWAILLVSILRRIRTHTHAECCANNVTVDLIDSMLVVDPERRFSIDQCLSHPWLTQTSTNVNDSTGGLVGGIAGLEVNRRAPPRERTLLSNLNSVTVAATVDGGDKEPVKVFAKNKHRVTNARKEDGPASQRAPKEFIEMGGKGDQVLFGDDSASIYPGETGSKDKSKQKTKTNGH